MWQNQDTSSESDQGADTVCHLDKNTALFLQEVRISQGSGTIRPKGGQKPPI